MVKQQPQQQNIKQYTLNVEVSSYISRSFAHELLYITFQQSSISLSLRIEVINYLLGTAVQKLSCGKLLRVGEWTTVNKISKLAVRVKRKGLHTYI